MIARDEAHIAGLRLPVFSLNTVVVGSGAAGLNCACRLFREMEETGVADAASQVALVTAGMGLGTSHNAGSDKQTYYKLGTQGAEGDTPLDFARTLTAGGCCHGDLALVEAENSLRCFYHLADLGVPFPHNERGGFVGYKTDHDPRQRATSAGPWTSRFMVRKLHAELKRYGLRVFDRCYALAIVRDERGVCGLLCVDIDRQEAPDHGLVLFNCRNVVMAGGGPGELYEISVYPRGQMGPFASLLEAGAIAQNLTESQFGLASLHPRWNLSGTYQQVIPRYFSTDTEGRDEREFLNPFFGSMGRLATDTFLKGYQWPFDPQKIAGAGSSLIDVLVQNEMVGHGRRVWMDFRSNPVATDGLEEFCLDALSPEARQYLERSGALQPTPIERLAHMNQPSIDLYVQMGVDLRAEPIETGVCSQHCNGGFVVDAWWESSVPHLFIIGELAGTHGVKRPGGSALNAGQVGGLRAAQRIAHVYYGGAAAVEEFARLAAPAVEGAVRRIGRVKGAGASALDCVRLKADVQHRMSEHAGMVRSAESVARALAQARAQWRGIERDGLRQQAAGYLEALQARELALAQLAFLEAIAALLDRGSGSRGSHLVSGASGALPHQALGEQWRYVPENEALRAEVLTVAYDAGAGAFRTAVEPVRLLPGGEFWFENTWARFREGRVFCRDDTERPRPHSGYGGGR